MNQPPSPVPTGRFPRVRKVPKALTAFGLAPHGLLPQPLRALVPPPAPPPVVQDRQLSPSAPERTPSPPPSPSYTRTPINGFGLYRTYLTMPTRDPEADLSLDNFCDGPTFAVAPSPTPRPWWTCFGRTAMQQVSEKFFAPFLNASTFRLMAWFYSGSSMKSLGELDRLVTEVLCADDFSVDDLQKFSAAREAQRIDEWEDMETSDGPFRSSDGWRTSSVSIHVPCEDTSQARPECETPEFTIPGVYHRSLVDIVRTAFESPAALAYHLTPFKLYAQTSNTTPPSLSTPSNVDAEPERVYSELYNSDAMNDEYERINASTARAAEAPSSSPSSPSNPALPTVSTALLLIFIPFAKIHVRQRSKRDLLESLSTCFCMRHRASNLVPNPEISHLRMRHLGHGVSARNLSVASNTLCHDRP